MIRGSDPCFPSSSEPEGVHDPNQLYHDVMEASYDGAVVGSETQLRSLLCSLSVLKHKVHEVETLVSMFLSHENHHHQSQSQPFASIGTLIQEIVVNASSMMFNCQQMTINSSSQTGNHNSNSNSNNNSDNNNNSQPMQSEAQLPNNNPHHFVPGCGVISKIPSNNQEFLDGDQSFFTWYSNDNNNPSYNNNNISRATCSTVTATTTTTTTTTTTSKSREKRSSSSVTPEAYDLVEPDAADLLAKYTHYCQVCGKGFKRDANLRMHMRAHGDEYKSTAALSNPLKKQEGVREESSSEMKPPRKYSCPQQGCRWNKNHAKFQPLKSIICVKNHYKRSHCPKMYVCKRCNRKNFSVLSDLRTHEKHCGDRKWQCSCGTTFSRKDKLMGHVTLFVGHSPILHSLADSTSKLPNHGELQIQFEDR